MLDDKNNALATVEAKHKIVVDKLSSDLAEARTQSTAEARRLEDTINASCRIILGNFLNQKLQILSFVVCHN